MYTDRVRRLNFTDGNIFSAHKAGRFDAEIEPIEIKSKKGSKQFAVDEHPRPDTTPEQIAKLPPVFMKGGTVNAGNASVSKGMVSTLCFRIRQSYYIS